VSFSRSSFILVVESNTNRLQVRKKWIFQKIEIAIILIIFQIFTLDGRFVSSLDGFKSTLSMNEIKDGTILYLVDGRSNIIQKLEFM
jgi:hypothetical protein